MEAQEECKLHRERPRIGSEPTKLLVCHRAATKEVRSAKNKDTNFFDKLIIIYMHRITLRAAKIASFCEAAEDILQIH